MEIKELIRLCNRVSPLDGKTNEYLMLTVTRTYLPKGNSVRLCGTFGPLGRIATVKGNGLDGLYFVTAYFSCKKVLKCIKDNE